MKHRIALAMLALVAAGCGGGADDTATTTTTTEATTTTTDPAPVIRQYASAVAPALARLTSGKVCSSRPTCAMEQAAAWESMMGDLELLADQLPPAEISGLVLEVLEVDQTFRPRIDAITGCVEDYQAKGDPVAALTECDPLVTVFDAWVADAASALERWRPYV
jgi:hypothetical protein